MLAALGLKPISMDEITVRIESLEEAIWNRNFPYVILQLYPTLHDLGASNHRPFSWCSLINNTFRARRTSARWAYTLPINTLMYDDDITRIGASRGRGDGPKHLGR